MKLPRFDIPNYNAVLPVSLDEVKYRPYTVKEEKILLLAVQSDSSDDKLEAVIQLISNCANVDAELLHPTDLEWLFMQIRSCSVSSMVEVNYNVIPESCGAKEEQVCPNVIRTAFDISEVQVKNIDEMNKAAIKKNGAWIVMLSDIIGVQFKIRTIKEAQDPLYELVESIIDGPNVYSKEDFSAADFEEFINGFSPLQLKPISDFLHAVPFSEVEITSRCSVCKKEFKSTVTDIVNFLV